MITIDIHEKEIYLYKDIEKLNYSSPITTWKVHKIQS